jgi:hypothetical protein
MSAAARCVLLAGAPQADELNSAGTIFLEDFSPSIKRFLGEVTTGEPSALLTSTPLLPSKWRSVSMTNSAHDAMHLDTGNDPQTRLLSLDANHHDGSNDDAQARLQFLEHSLALLTDLKSSQIVGPEETTFVSTTSFATVTTGTSFATSDGSLNLSSTAAENVGQIRTDAVTFRGDITDVTRIPTADFITRISPQTVTVNLIVAVVAVSPIRTVRLRKRPAEKDILELIVGDETQAGFSISFWLAPADTQKKEPDDLRGALQGVKSGDVLLLQNIALSGFRGCVYGQSLSRQFARNSTVITLIEDDGPGSEMCMFGKTKRVRRWADEFVGRTKAPAALSALSMEQTNRKALDDLPPDTQDGTDYN